MLCTDILTPVGRLLLHVKPPQDFRVSSSLDVCFTSEFTNLPSCFSHYTGGLFSCPEIYWPGNLLEADLLIRSLLVDNELPTGNIFWCSCFKYNSYNARPGHFTHSANCKIHFRSFKQVLTEIINSQSLGLSRRSFHITHIASL